PSPRAPCPLVVPRASIRSRRSAPSDGGRQGWAALAFSESCDYNVVAMADSLGSFEQAVLLAIVRLESGAYGRAILKEVQVRLERDVAAGAVQATLERLERKGLVRSKLGS